MATMLDINEAWENFCDGDYEAESNNKKNTPNTSKETPKCSPIYISTKTKISYLNTIINLKDAFWKVPIVPYHKRECGVIKKQMKFNSNSEEELEAMQRNLSDNVYTDEHIISRIINPEGRIKFRDVRKVSIGLCKKDITSYRCKKKGAFYNCFALILRIKYKGEFKEIHVKVFNTGKLEIPGIQTDDVLDETLKLLTQMLTSISNKKDKITWLPEKTETVLINSNFSCGYYVDRDKLYNILKYKYGINSAYDPCSYPGIQCAFYYNKLTKEQDGKQPKKDTDKDNYSKMSFMIFRTGSVLIVGKCTENILKNIYLFLKNLLEKEYSEVGGELIKKETTEKKKKKIRKKTIIVT
jgi:TATA-box binding protein (TBP) (component of TFIID and TFIIIB)